MFPPAIRRALQAVFELLACTDVEALYILSSARKAKMVDMQDCTRFHFLSAGRFDWRGRGSLLRATTAAGMAALLPPESSGAADMLIPDHCVARILQCSARKMRPCAKAWLQRHWAALMGHLVFWACQSAQQSGAP